MSTIDDLTNNPRLGVVRLDTNAKLPTKVHYGDLGYDLYTLEDVKLIPGKVTIVRTGISCNFPPGFGALIRDRSSVSTKQEVFVVAGVIDQGYTGEIKIAFFNPSKLSLIDLGKDPSENRLALADNKEMFFKKGEKIAQMILIPVVTIPVDEVTESQGSSRGDQGFGSSGQ